MKSTQIDKNNTDIIKQSNDMPIIDLHCDLLGCIEHNKGKLHYNSPELNCSLPQLKEGGVKLQVLAIAAITGKGSSQVGLRQLDLFKQLPPQDDIDFLLSIENASALLEEDEPLALFHKRLEMCHHEKRVLYVSLTWNQENRFGGGNLSQVGLKPDGEATLDVLAEKGIAIDFSHTSDWLAHDILNYIDKKGLSIPILASHSNYREVWDVPRNLPQVFAQEIINRGGLIGINFVRRFVGETPEAFIRHIEYALQLGGEKAICLGCDYYGGLDISQELCPGKAKKPFFPEHANASLYPTWTQLLRTAFKEELVQQICYKNVEAFQLTNAPLTNKK